VSWTNRLSLCNGKHHHVDDSDRRRALTATKNAGLQPALDWLLANPGAGGDDDSAIAAPTGYSLGGGPSSSSSQDASVGKTTHAATAGNTANSATAGNTANNATAGNATNNSYTTGKAEDDSDGGDHANETAAEASANSLKCDDCGRLLRDTTAAQAHAMRTGHANFSQSTEEIKPLTGTQTCSEGALRLVYVMS
jgi:hypothetical protein